MTYPTALLIDGDLRSGSGAARPVINPATEEILVRVPDASAADAQNALTAAARAWPEWGADTQDCLLTAFSGGRRLGATGRRDSLHRQAR